MCFHYNMVLFQKRDDFLNSLRIIYDKVLLPSVNVFPYLRVSETLYGVSVCFPLISLFTLLNHEVGILRTISTVIK